MRPVLVALGLLLVPSVASARPRCWTPALLQLRAATEGTFAATADYRPEAVGWVDSEVYPIRVHYRRAEDAGRAADVVLPLAEESWRVEIEEMGWPAPPADEGAGGDDRYDLYLTNEDTYGGAWTWGFGADTNPDDELFSVPSFIALDDRSISDDDMGDFVSHELNHAMQYGMDAWEMNLFVWEMTAQAMEDYVFDETNLYAIDIPDFQELPFASLLHDGYSTAVKEYDDYSYYEYGGVAFGLFLDEAYGVGDGTKLRDLWFALAQPSRLSDPDWIDALPEISGESLLETYTRFAEWRLFAAGWDDGAHYSEAGDWGADTRPAHEPELAAADLDGLETTAEDLPYDLGVSYFLIDPQGSDARYEVVVEGDADARWGLVTVAWLEDGPARVVRMTAEEGPVTAELDLAGAKRAVIGVVNGGPKNLDAEDDIPRRTFTLKTAIVADPPTGDDTGDGLADDDSEKPESAGCGCATGGAAPGLAGVLLALAAARRRR